MDLQTTLKGQYHAGLAMLRNAIEDCTEDLWTSGSHHNPFWHVAYHTLYFTHLYLEPNEAAFTPWGQHRDEYQFLGPLPWPPHRLPNIGEPYMKTEVLDYWGLCDGRVDTSVDRVDLDAPDSGFWWYRMPKLDHQLVNIRHIQHHAGQLADRVRASANIGIEWVGEAP
jgi:hypothetical protein